MKTIVAGSREITDYQIVAKAIKDSGFEITELVSGACKRGVDPLGEKYAFLNDIPVKRFPADWSNQNLGKGAGALRNRQMAAYAEALICVWDGVSPGTFNMICEAKLKGLKVFVVNIRQEESVL